MKASVMEEVKRIFKPEFLNRIDEVIMFNSLSRDVIREIVLKIVNEIESRLSSRKIKLVFTDKAIDQIIKESYVEAFGARPIRRYITKNIETLLAKELLNDNLYDTLITVDYDSKYILRQEN